MKLSRKLYMTVGITVILPFLLFFRLFVKYKIAILRVDRLGHLALNTNLFFRKIKLGMIPEDTRYYLVAPNLSSKDVANSYLLGMYKRYSNSFSRVKTITSTKIFFLLEKNKKVLNMFSLLYELQMNSNEKEFSLDITTLTFTKDERIKGQQFLKRIGVNIGDKTVCIFGRDSSYLQKKYNSINWSYHDYRDMDIDTYIETIKYLISKGYQVIRIGSVVSKAVDFKHKKFIDYSLMKERTGFYDLFLISNASFIIGSSSGATDVAVIFNKAFLGVNYAPFLFSPFGLNNLYIPKKIINAREGNKLVPFKNVKHIDEKRLFDGEYIFQKYGFSYIDNTSAEILDAAIEMEQRTTNLFVESQCDINLMSKYFEQYGDTSRFINSKSKLCLKWLKNNQELYF